MKKKVDQSQIPLANRTLFEHGDSLQHNFLGLLVVNNWPVCIVGFLTPIFKPPKTLSSSKWDFIGQLRCKKRITL